MYKKILYFLSFAAIVSCDCSNNCENKGFGEVPDSVINEGVYEVSTEAVKDIIENISSPIETAALIQSLGVPFSKKYLAPTDFLDNYNTSYTQAFNLGVFGADLGYLNIYNKTGPVIEYITAIKNLADAIKVGQFFDFTTLKRLATNNQNLDSLMYISVHSFNMMDNYLRENRRSSLSVLMIAGVWIEGLYLATEVAKENPSPEIAEKIGEQKIILADLMLILNNYRNTKYFKTIIRDFENIKELYNGVSVTYEQGEPEAIEKDGILMIVQNDKSIVTISDDQLNKIIKKTAEIRNKLIGS